ncbi:MAG TPA: hypothetical protein VG733_05400 [Chthoniobacteraceae bacterium]|nr:hypothetical protein [Chthoniobacteraceae bacterium]
MNGTIAIPEGLRHQFEKLEKRLWRFDTIVAICGAVCSLLLSYALIFVSDRLWDTPPFVRLIFTGAGVAMFGVFIYGYCRRWVWGDRSFPTLATLVQRRYRRLGDRLLGIVELADDHKRPAMFSEALVKAAIDQVATEASKVDFQQAVGTKRPRQYMTGLVIAAVLPVLFFIVAPQAFRNALLRWLQPTGNVQRYTFVNFDDLPSPYVVPHGEPFDLQVGVNATSLLHPTQLVAQFDGQDATSAPVKNHVALLHLAGQTDPIKLTLKAGDISHSMQIQPEFRPEIKQLTAHVVMPAYLQYPPADQKVEGGQLIYLKGSTIVFNGQATRGLKEANLEVAKKLTPLSINNDTFSTAPVVPEGIAQWIFSWKDRYDLEAVAPMKVRLQEKQDEPPRVDCRGMPGTVAILETEVVHVDVVADDDFGIQDVGVRWQTAIAKSDKLSDPVEHKIAQGDPQSKTVKAEYDFSPQLLHIPEGTSVSFCATATDRFPGRPASMSSVHQIYILSTAEQANLIQQKLDMIAARFEDLTRQQESLVDASNAVKAMDPSKMSDQDTTKKLDDQANEQKDTADQLKDLAKDLADTLQQAGKNPDIQPQTMEKWAKAAEQMNSLGQNAMPQASQSLANAEQNPNQRQQPVNQANQQQQDILNQMRQMQQDMEKAMQKLMTQNLALRLRHIAASEKNIADNFQKMLPDIIGAKTDQLPDQPKNAIGDMSKLEDNSHKDSNKLEGEIARMFERTQVEKYGDVSNEMDKAQTDDALGKLTQVISDNVSVQAIQSANQWSKQFTSWADQLDKQDDQQQQQGEQGQQGQPDMKALMALLKIREQEDELRDRTGALENQKAADQNYNQDAKDTSDKQDDVRSQLQALQDDPDFPVPPEKLGPATKAMRDAKGKLDKPDTGDPTVADETDAINILDAVIMEQAQKSGQSMASLMAMMGMKPGQKPGKGFFGGGDTNRQNEVIPGSRVGDASDPRHITQTTGNAGAPLPAEFRDAIENYQHAVEQQQ